MQQSHLQIESIADDTRVLCAFRRNASYNGFAYPIKYATYERGLNNTLGVNGDAAESVSTSPAKILSVEVTRCSGREFQAPKSVSELIVCSIHEISGNMYHHLYGEA